MKHTRPICVRRVSRNICRQRRYVADNCAVETGGGKEGVSWKNVENDGKEPYLRGMWADEAKQAGVQGQKQQEAPAKEYLEQVKCCHGTDCNESMMKKGFTALKNGTWEEF